MYKKGKREALTSLALTSGLIFWLYKETKDKHLWYPLAFAWLKVPVTYGMMKVQWKNEAEKDAEQMETFLKNW